MTSGDVVSLPTSSTDRIEALAIASAILPVLIGTIVLTGWATRSYPLTQFFTAGSAMQPVTALCAILTGVGVVSATRAHPGLVVARIVASLVFLAALQTLAQHLLGLDLVTDRLLFADAIDHQPISYVYPGRMAAPTATAFALLGIALFVAPNGDRTAGRFMSGCATAVLLLAAVAFLSQFYEVAPFVGALSFTQVALPTALALAGLSIGILALRPQRGWVGVLVGNGVGATVARWLFPSMIAVPVIVGLLALRGSDVGLYPADFRLALMTGVTAVLLGTLVLWGSSQFESLVAVRRAAEVSRENEATLRAFFETEGLFASIIERRGDELHYLAANRALSRLFGREDITGLTQRDLVGEDGSRQMIERLRAIEAGGAPTVLEMRHDAEDGPRWFMVTTSPIADSPVDAPHFATTSFEITERKRAEAHQQTLLLELTIA